jgi:cation diffusion facilitator family transporter
MNTHSASSHTVCNQSSELSLNFSQIEQNEKRTLWVIILTLVMMVVEVVTGHLTGSMALLADGYHMASHAGALGISYLVYRLAKSETLKQKLNFGSGKLLPLGGYTSAVGLVFISLWMIIESFERLLNPIAIRFEEAIVVAVVGLVVNILSAFILGFGKDGHGHSHSHNHNHDHGHEHDHAHDHSHSMEDHNHKGAIMHVLADALTSVLAILALVIGRSYDAIWLDPVIGLVGAFVIIRWAYGLCRVTAWELLDGQPLAASIDEVRSKIESTGIKVIDIHLWKVGPGNHAGQLIVESSVAKGSQHFKQFFPDTLKSLHLVVEERLS